MDEVTLLVSTLAMGATAALKETAGTAVKDAYSGLKALIVKKFGSQPAIDALERKPDSENKQGAAKEDLAEVASDTEIMERAKALANVVQREDPGVAEVIGVSLEDITAKFLEIDTVESSGSGVKILRAKFEESVTIKNVKAGQGDKPRP